MRKSFTNMLTAAILAGSVLAAGSALAQRGTVGNGGVSGHAGFDPNRFNPKDTRNPAGRGLAALDAGDYVVAEKMFDAVLDETPDDPDVLVLSGMAKAGHQDYRGARKQYERALRADRNSIDGHRELALVLAKLGDVKGAQGQLAALKGMQCGAGCDAGKLQRAVSTVDAALAPPKPAQP